MISITPTLEAAQKTTLFPDQLYKVVLTDGVDTLTYTSTTILDGILTQSEFHNATIVLDNSGGTIVDLHKWRALISCGYTTDYADEYATYAPLYVIGQRYGSIPGKKTSILNLIGVPNLLNMDEANDDYLPKSDDASTITDLINAIFDPTLACYSHCEAILVVFDDSDPLMAFKPKDTFRILQGETRWAKLKWLLSFTSSVAKVVYSSTVGQEAGVIHIFIPKSATPYHYIYNRTSGNTDTGINTNEPLDASETGVDVTPIATTAIPIGSLIKINDEYMQVTATGWTLTVVRAPNATTHDTNQDIYILNHNYQGKSKDNTLILPNYVEVSSSPDHETQCVGSAQVTGYDSLFAALKKRTHKRMRLATEGEGNDLAAAFLAAIQRNDELGYNSLKGNMNVAAEIYDYIQIADAWDSSNIAIGNIGIIERHFGPGKFDMNFHIGKVQTGKLAGLQETIASQLKEEIPELLKLTTRIVYLKVIAEDTTLTTGDGKAYWTVPQEFNNYTIINVAACVYTVSSSGTPTIQIHNLTDAVDILSTPITIDINEYNSYIAAIPPVINTANAVLATGDRIRIDVDVSGTGTKGLDVPITIQLK